MPRCRRVSLRRRPRRRRRRPRSGRRAPRQWCLRRPRRAYRRRLPPGRTAPSDPPPSGVGQPAASPTPGVSTTCLHRPQSGCGRHAALGRDLLVIRPAVRMAQPQPRSRRASRRRRLHCPRRAVADPALGADRSRPGCRPAASACPASPSPGVSTTALPPPPPDTDGPDQAACRAGQPPTVRNTSRESARRPRPPASPCRRPRARGRRWPRP